MARRRARPTSSYARSPSWPRWRACAHERLARGLSRQALSRPVLFDMGAPRWPPSPPTFGPPRRSRGAPLCRVCRARVREAIQRVGAREGDALSVRAVVVGAEPLGLAIVERLVAAGARVTVLAAAAELARTGAPAVIGSATAPGELLAAGLAEADVLVLATDSDAENVDAALTARRLRPKVRLVVRVFDRRLADYLRGTLEHIEVMSMALASAPVF